MNQPLAPKPNMTCKEAGPIGAGFFMQKTVSAIYFICGPQQLLAPK